MRAEKQYPSIDGVPVSPFELDLPISQLDLAKEHNWNNHHACFEARSFGKIALFQTMRDLERHQYLTPIDFHANTHRFYSPPRMPTLEQAITDVSEAYDSGERLRYGSARNPTYKPIGRDVMNLIYTNYRELV